MKALKVAEHSPSIDTVSAFDPQSRISTADVAKIGKVAKFRASHWMLATTMRICTLSITAHLLLPQLHCQAAACHVSCHLWLEF